MYVKVGGSVMAHLLGEETYVLYDEDDNVFRSPKGSEVDSVWYAESFGSREAARSARTESRWTVRPSSDFKK